MFFKEDITEKEIEVLARVLTGVIRNEVLEDLHADEGGNYIPQEIMGETKDKIRNSLYNHFTAMNKVKDSKPFLDAWDKMIDNLHENNREVYPIKLDEKKVAFRSAIYAVDMESLEKLGL
tara:strand:+ start:513 stop:872 length:360 start_codon:yes stop_codon:yes gene_type:complete